MRIIPVECLLFQKNWKTFPSFLFGGYPHWENCIPRASDFNEPPAKIFLIFLFSYFLIFLFYHFYPSYSLFFLLGAQARLGGSLLT
jgi:hypothetical protein